MAPYNFNMNDVIFESNKIIYVVDLNPEKAGLYRQNAMTVYQHITPFMIEAKCVESNKIFFYLVYCKNHGWVKVDEDIANYIINHKSVKPPLPPLPPKQTWSTFMLFVPIIWVTGVTFYRKFHSK